MGKGVGHGNAARVALQRIIANLTGRIHRLGNIATFQRAKTRLRLARPDTGIAIGLKFNPDRNRVRLGFADLRAN